MQFYRRFAGLMRIPTLSVHQIRNFVEQKELDKSVESAEFKTIFSNGNFIAEGRCTKRWLGQKTGVFFLLTVVSMKYLAVPFWIVTIYLASDAMAKQTALGHILKTSICRIEVSQKKPKMVTMFIGPCNYKLTTRASNIRSPIHKEALMEKCGAFVSYPDETLLDLYALIKDPAECDFEGQLSTIEKNYLVVSYSKGRGDVLDLDEMIQLLGK